MTGRSYAARGKQHAPGRRVPLLVAGTALALAACDADALLILEVQQRITRVDYRLFEDSDCSGTPFDENGGEPVLSERYTPEGGTDSKARLAIVVTPPWQSKLVRIDLEARAAVPEEGADRLYWCGCFQLPEDSEKLEVLVDAAAGLPDRCAVHRPGEQTPPFIHRIEGPGVVALGQSVDYTCHTQLTREGQQIASYDWELGEPCQSAPHELTVDPASPENLTLRITDGIDEARCNLTCRIADQAGLEDRRTKSIVVTSNHPPEVTLSAEPTTVLEQKLVHVICATRDEDEEDRSDLDIVWSQVGNWILADVPDDGGACPAGLERYTYCARSSLLAPELAPGESSSTTISCIADDLNVAGRIESQRQELTAVASSPPEGMQLMVDGQPVAEGGAVLVAYGANVQLGCSVTGDPDEAAGLDDRVVSVAISMNGETQATSATLYVSTEVQMPTSGDRVPIVCTAADTVGEAATATFFLDPVDNNPPSVDLTVEDGDRTVFPEQPVDLTCEVSDVDGHPVLVTWSARWPDRLIQPDFAALHEEFACGEGSRCIRFTPPRPAADEVVTITCTAKDDPDGEITSPPADNQWDPASQETSMSLDLTVRSVLGFDHAYLAFYGQTFIPQGTDRLRYITYKPYYESSPYSCVGDPENNIEPGISAWRSTVGTLDDSETEYLYVVASSVAHNFNAVVVGQAANTAKAFLVRTNLVPGSEGSFEQLDLVGLEDAGSDVVSPETGMRVGATVAADTFGRRSPRDDILVAATVQVGGVTRIRTWLVTPEWLEEEPRLPLEPLETAASDPSSEPLRWLNMDTDYDVTTRAYRAVIGGASYRDGVSEVARAALWISDQEDTTFILLPGTGVDLISGASTQPVVQVLFHMPSNEPALVFPTDGRVCGIRWNGEQWDFAVTLKNINIGNELSAIVSCGEDDSLVGWMVVSEDFISELEVVRWGTTAVQDEIVTSVGIDTSSPFSPVVPFAMGAVADLKTEGGFDKNWLLLFQTQQHNGDVHYWFFGESGASPVDINSFTDGTLLDTRIERLSSRGLMLATYGLETLPDFRFHSVWEFSKYFSEENSSNGWYPKTCGGGHIPIKTESLDGDGRRLVSLGVH